MVAAYRLYRLIYSIGIIAFHKLTFWFTDKEALRGLLNLKLSWQSHPAEVSLLCMVFFIAEISRISKTENGNSSVNQDISSTENYHN